MESLYNLIIVDDEYIIRDGLVHFNWENFGFKVAGSASDGKEALELMGQHAVNLVITDLKMPVMGGLELCDIIQKKYPQTKVIILTGYKEFEYAQQAIRTGVVEYLLKPVELSAIEELIVRVKQELDKQRGTELLIDSYQKQLRDSLPLAIENFLRSLVHGGITDLSEIEGKSNNLEVYLNHSYFTCSVFELNIEQTDSDVIDSKRMNRLINEDFRNISESASIYYFFESDNKLVIIYNFEADESQSSTYQYIEALTERLHSSVKNCIQQTNCKSIFAGTGNIYSSITYLAVTYKQALQALELRFFNDNSELFFAWKEKSIYSNCENYYPYEKEQILINIVLSGNKEEVPKSLEDFWSDLGNSLKQINPEHFRNIVNQLLNMLERNLQKFSIHLSEFIPDNRYYSEYMASLPSVTSVKAEIKNIFVKTADYIDQIQNRTRSSSFHAISQALKYIEENYANNISLTEVAEKVFLNASYLSFQFKKETGMNFVNYLDV